MEEMEFSLIYSIDMITKFILAAIPLHPRKPIAEVFQYVDNENSGASSLIAICPSQELTGLFRHFKEKYKKGANTSPHVVIGKGKILDMGRFTYMACFIEKMEKEKEEEKTFNLIYLSQLNRKTTVVIKEVNLQTTIENVMHKMEWPLPPSFLAICSKEETGGIVGHFMRKYWSHEIKRVTRKV